MRCAIRFWFSILSILLAISLCGCDESPFGNHRQYPAPVRYDFPYELNGMPQGIWGGDHFQFRQNDRLHYIVIEGLHCPDPGEPFYNEARNQLIQLINFNATRIEVIKRDSQTREIGFVFVKRADIEEPLRDRLSDQPELDVALEMIRLGWGEYDGADIEQAESYRIAEEEAKKEKRGQWK